MSKGITRNQAKRMVGPGWSSIIDKIYDNITSECYVMQVKEKWGYLHFYTGGLTPEEEAVIDAAEKESCITCEDCGGLGTLRSDLPWVLTLCDSHYKDALEKLNQDYKKALDFLNKM